MRYSVVSRSISGSISRRLRLNVLRKDPPQPEPEPTVISLEAASPKELVELARNPEMAEPVRAEVYRRLKDGCHRPALLVFRFLASPDDADRADAYNGLMALGWNAVKFRRALDPRYYSDPASEKILSWAGTRSKPGPSKIDGREETRDRIANAVVDEIYPFRDLPFPELVDKALTGAFDRVIENGANAVRRQHRQAKRTSPIPEGAEVVEASRPDDFEPRSYQELFEICEPEITGYVGENGHLILLTFVAVAANLPDGQRDRQKALTEVVKAVLGVEMRQAQKIKKQVLDGVKKAMAEGSLAFHAIYKLLIHKTEPQQPPSFGAGLSFDQPFRGDSFDEQQDPWDAANSSVARSER